MTERRHGAGGAIVGVSDHYGWAALMTVTREGTLVDRRRVALVDDGLPDHPYHYEGQVLPLEEALEVIERVRASAERRAQLALEEVATAVSARIVGLALRECPQLPPTVAARIRDYRAQCVADSVMYRMALAGAAEAKGWTVHWYDPRKVFEGAGHALRADFETRFHAMRKSMGPPWGKDQMLAMSAAIVAAHSKQPQR